MGKIRVVQISERQKLMDENEILKLKIENKQLQDGLNILNAKIIRKYDK